MKNYYYDCPYCNSNLTYSGCDEYWDRILKIHNECHIDKQNE